MKEFLVALAAVALAITTLATFSKRTAALITRFFVGPYRWIKEQSEAARQTKAIVKELTTNSGSSLKDAILRIDTKVQTIDAKIIEDGQRIKALMEDHPDGIFETNVTGDMIWVNRTFCRLMGRQICEILGRGWEQCIDISQRGDVIEEWERCVSVGREFNRKVHYRQPDSTHVWLQVHSYKITNRIGITIGFTGYARLIDPPAKRCGDDK